MLQFYLNVLSIWVDGAGGMTCKALVAANNLPPAPAGDSCRLTCDMGTKALWAVVLAM
jgi:hypothetical protein